MEKITITDKMILVDGAPDCFLTPIQSLEHLDSWSRIPVDVNLEGDAFADPDVEDHSNDPTINYDCVAWQ